MNHRVNSQTVFEELPDDNLGYLPGEAEEHSCGGTTESEKCENV